MKVKVISRSTDEHTKERSQDLQRVFHNYDPAIRPQEKAVEYVRALNAAKLDKIFAKPFVGAMDGHIDAISCMAKNMNHLVGIFSGSMDGDIRHWDIASRRTVHQFPGHQGAVRGLAVSTDGRVLVSCGTDCSVRLWAVPISTAMELDVSSDKSVEPLETYVWKNAFRSVDHQWNFDRFATGGAGVDIWNHNRSAPEQSLEWGTDTVISVRFNPGQPDLLATSASDRSIALYDLRMGKPTAKLIMATKTNSICWNPMEPFNFTAANEDCNCYSFDSRKLNAATCVHKDHVSAVMDIDYSPTGREFVTGSYDRTVRIFQYNGGHSREIYHTKRMQRVFCVKFSCDASYVISGSDDTNLRLWKAKASEQLGVLLPREKKRHEYHEAVKNRYKHLPEVKRIVRHRHLPKPIYKATGLRRTMIEAERRREEKRKAHSAPGSITSKPLRQRRIVRVEE
ncbi:putative transcription factor WD40-like family [Rosa chinensis]|uniref:Putative transcription factor WD40-like family n=1 Tax=Rosa chinensis TaxID=74649 RepID=A0A2P6PQ16_ROSCH|nr:DDB1- and CUL4-associated factor 13 [Rosa chinensis]XP_024165410.1 DDB1- and CUL4-associated factor 13 [Rosa chinensis]PRQ24028.1 putative transcription factor WD40-like family [Rosa chinensis]